MYYNDLKIMETGSRYTIAALLILKTSHLKRSLFVLFKTQHAFEIRFEVSYITGLYLT